ncbi:MAG: YggT family protein [Clostridia bacterium]|nr:YggT family protein [Clostridia bacterium]
MEILDFVLSSLISMLCMLGVCILTLNAILSWIAPDAEGTLFNFIYNVNDFLTAPMKALLDRLGWFAGSPIDMSHLFTLMLLSVISMLFTLL